MLSRSTNIVDEPVLHLFDDAKHHCLQENTVQVAAIIDR